MSTFAICVFFGGGGYGVDFDGLVFLVEADETTFNFIEDGGGWPGKGSLYIFLILSRGLYIQHLVVPCQFEGFLPTDHPLARHITFITNKYKYDISIAVVLDIFNPASNISEGIFPGEIEDNQSSC